MCYGFGNTFGWWGMGFGFIGHLIFVVFIVAAAAWLFKKISRGNQQEVKSNALEILKLRYAKGEINSTEYQQMKTELE